MTLIDVLADLPFVPAEILQPALRIKHEAVRDEVDRREVRLQAAAPELREVAVRRKSQDAFDDRRQDGLGQHLLVLAGARQRQVPAEIGCAVHLTPAEVEALRGAGAWYAKYHAVRVAELADDPSAYAEHKREKFLMLVSALRKLGFDMAIPDALRSHERNAA